MSTISTKVGCRKCLRTDGIPTMLFVSSELGVKLKKQTEIHVAKYVKDNFAGSVICPFCNSSNLEFFDIEIDGFVMYDFDRIQRLCSTKGFKLFTININKVEDSFEVNFGGDLFISKEAVKGFLNHVKNFSIDFFVDELPELENGNFFCMCSQLLFTKYR